MKGLPLAQIFVSTLLYKVDCDSSQHHHAHSRTNIFDHGNNNGGSTSSGGGVNSGYGAPSGGSVSSGYGAPSGGVSSGYGAPSGGGVSSGYGAPSGGGGGVSSGYGAPSGGGSSYDGGAPVYVYQQGAGGGADNGGGVGGGLLSALLPIGAIALLGGLGLFTFGALFPAVTITGRKKRDVNNSTIPEQQLLLLHNYVETFSDLPDRVLQQDMVAKYLECGLGQGYDSPSLQGCLQKLSCIVQDPEVYITDDERKVAEIVIQSILGNEYISKNLKKSVMLAGKKGARGGMTCHMYKCHHHLLPIS